MFGSIGGSEIFLIMALALLLFGPRKLPQIGRQIGQTLGQFRRAANDFKMDLEREVKAEEVRETTKDLKTAGDQVSRIGREITRTIASDEAGPARSTDPPAAPADPPASTTDARSPEEQ